MQVFKQMASLKRIALAAIGIAALTFFSTANAQTFAPWLRIEQLDSNGYVDNLQVSVRFTVNGVPRTSMMYQFHSPYRPYSPWYGMEGATYMRLQPDAGEFYAEDLDTLVGNYQTQTPVAYNSDGNYICAPPGYVQAGYETPSEYCHLIIWNQYPGLARTAVVTIKMQWQSLWWSNQWHTDTITATWRPASESFSSLFNRIYLKPSRVTSWVSNDGEFVPGPGSPRALSYSPN